MNDGFYCLMEDEEGHWYCIPVGLRDRFEELITKVYEFGEWEEFAGRFDKYRLSSHPTRYKFKNLERME